MVVNGIVRLAYRSCGRSFQQAVRHASRSANYSTVLSPSQPDQVQVKVGSNGFVNLDIYHPPQSPKNGGPVIIYLPRGPIPLPGIPEPPSLLPLATSANTTVVRLNYRSSKEYRFPLPIHDVLAGYDWIVQNLTTSTQVDPRNDTPGKVAVCGEFIGGSLAASLALTECRTDSTGVRALVMGNPISDWTAMNLIPRPTPDLLAVLGKTKTGRKKRVAKLAAWEAFAHSDDLPAAALLRLRNSLFKTAEDYFDVFASPMLLFRTPAIDVPVEVDALDEIFLPPDIAAQPPQKKRKSHRRFPPLDTALTLPYTKVMVGEKSLLKDQGIELAEGIARSIHSYGGPMGNGEGTGWERVEVEIKAGLGVWNEDTLGEIGTSLRESMRS